jgi:hypothetical protein
MQPPLQHTVAPEKPASPPPSTEKKAAVPKKATHSLPAASSHSEMRKLIESCGHTLNQKPPSDAEAQARRRHWVLDSAAVLLLCDEPEEAERAFYERMIQGISQRLAPAALITTAEAAIWGGWNQLVFGKQVKLLLLSHSISVLELEFTLRSLPLLTHEQYKDVAPRKELWENIQAFFE